MQNTVDLLILNIGCLITVSTNGTNSPICNKSMDNLGILSNVGIAVKDGKIFDILKTSEAKNKYKAKKVIDAKNNLVMPGFIDSHTHIVYGGIRDSELKMRMSGATYLDILKSGGGIHSTVNETRKASMESLYSDASGRIKLANKHGTTSLEIKSGYGLDYDNELKILKVINKLKKLNFVDIVSTYLGAHTFPKELARQEYIDLIISKCLPDFKDLATYCDIYSEEGAFSSDEAKLILSKAKDLGYKLKIHSGQFTNNGSTLIAANLGASSADHLDVYDNEDVKTMKKNNTVAVLMPESIFFLLSEKYPDARNLIDSGVIVALATDANPGSAPGFSMQFVITLAFFKMKMSIEEAIIASTINSAYAIGINDRVGSIEIGKQADILIFDIKKPIEIPYYFGTNLVNTVIKNGKVC